MGSAQKCISRVLGLCQLKNENDCYAYKAEKQYPNVFPYREEQRVFWRGTSSLKIAIQFKRSISRRRTETRYIRINESGDIKDSMDIVKLEKIAKFLGLSLGTTTYLYTARRDMKEELMNNLKHVVKNGSGFMLDNEFRVVEKFTGKHAKCNQDCRTCNLCKKKLGIVIEQEMH